MNNVIFICFSMFSVMLFYGVYGHPTSLKSTPKFPYYNREDWGSVPSQTAKPLSVPVPYVVIHHTYIPGACHTTEECSNSMRSMQNYHRGLGWGDIGYNFCVGSEGGAYEGRGWHTTGIHAGGANRFSIGICLIGDWRVNVPPQVQLETTKALIAAGVEKGIISPNYKLIGHRQAMTTECPGEALFEEISKWEHFSADGFQSNKVLKH